MSGTDCYLDRNGCVVCPQVAAAPAVPPRVTTSANFGWNAGANSVAVLDDDVHMVESFSAAPVDVFLGFKYTRDGQTAPYGLAYAFRLYALGVNCIFEIWEGPLQCVGPSPYTLGQPLEIIRLGGQVLYNVNGAQVYASSKRSSGPLLVNACLFSAGDTLP